MSPASMSRASRRPKASRSSASCSTRRARPRPCPTRPRGAGSPGARRRHLLLAARVAAVRSAGDRGGAGRYLPRRHRDRHQPGRRRAARRRCRSPVRSRQSGRPARPCWRRSTGCPQPGVQGPQPMTDTPATFPADPRPRAAVDAASIPRVTGARPGRRRRVRDRPGRGGDRAGGRPAVAALLAGGSARYVARPGRRAAGATDRRRRRACASIQRHSMPPSASSPPGSTISTSASRGRRGGGASRSAGKRPADRRAPRQRTIRDRRAARQDRRAGEPAAPRDREGLAAQDRDRGPARGDAVARPGDRRQKAAVDKAAERRARAPAASRRHSPPPAPRR